MNPAQLLAHFEHIAEAPDAVPRLRRFILDLAVRGKLVEQDLNDEPVVELLNRVEVKASQFEIPRNWVSAPAGKLLNIQYGKALPARDRGDKGSVAVFGSNGIVGYCETPLAKEPAIIIGRKGSAGALNLCDGPSWTTDVAYYLVPPSFFSIRFLFLVLQTLDLGSLGKGVKPGLNRSDAYQLPVVVPPLAEQQRIVAKVDELMALCDELEAAQAKREKRRDRLVAATLHGLNNGDAFEASARFAFHHLPRFTTRPEHIHQLRQTILNLAVRGKLIEQGDGRASDVRERVKLERRKYGFPLGITGSDSNLYVEASRSASIPPTWTIAPLADIALAIVDCPHSTPKWSTTGRICVRTNQFRPGSLDLSDSRFVSEETYQERIERLKPREDDILYSREGGILGVACRVPRCVDLCLGQRMMLIRSASVCDSAFLELVLNSPLITSIATAKTTGGAAPRVNVATVKSYPIPLPALAEQHRIVTKVDELMALCDTLEAQLTTTAITSRQLLDATLHETLAD